MRITLRTEGTERITLSSDSLDNDNFIEISIDRPDDDSRLIAEVSIDSLMSALIGFDAVRQRNNKRDKSYEKN